MTDSSKRKRTLADVENNKGTLRERIRQAHRAAAAADARSREENQQRGTQVERSAHLASTNHIENDGGAGKRKRRAMTPLAPMSPEANPLPVQGD